MWAYTSSTVIRKLLEVVLILCGQTVLLDYGRIPNIREVFGDASIKLGEAVVGLFVVKLG